MCHFWSSCTQHLVALSEEWSAHTTPRYDPMTVSAVRAHGRKFSAATVVTLTLRESAVLEASIAEFPISLLCGFKPQFSAILCNL